MAMAEDLPSAFYDRLRRRMEKNVISKTAFNKGCWLWAGSMKSNSTYGTCYLSLPKGDRMRVNAHRASYIAFNEIFVLPLDISHCCHESSCVNPNHLSHEPHDINIERERCRKAGGCFGHSYNGTQLKPCMFCEE